MKTDKEKTLSFLRKLGLNVIYYDNLFPDKPGGFIKIPINRDMQSPDDMIVTFDFDAAGKFTGVYAGQ